MLICQLREEVLHLEECGLVIVFSAKENTNAKG